jgi:hypothetical protein
MTERERKNHLNLERYFSKTLGLPVPSQKLPAHDVWATFMLQTLEELAKGDPGSKLLEVAKLYKDESEGRKVDLAKRFELVRDRETHPFAKAMYASYSSGYQQAVSAAVALSVAKSGKTENETLRRYCDAYSRLLRGPEPQPMEF